jgi:hypothetical protein
MTDNVADPLPGLPAVEAATARAAYLAALGRFSPEIYEAGRGLLERIDRPNWAVEWSLPYWLGEAFGLRRQVKRALTLANVFGLAYVRLQDDAIDGELAREESATAPMLAAALYHLWLEQYRRLFDATSPFWHYFERDLATWLRAALRDGREPTASSNGTATITHEHALELAERGAPLKVGAIAACLLAFREHDVPAAEQAIDHLLGAAVLLDHVHDWSEDVEAGRYNAFVSYALGRHPGDAGSAGARRAVLEEIYLDGAGRSYLALVQELIEQAQEKARPLGCTGLSHYLDRLDENVAAYSTRLGRHAERTLQAAVTHFFDAQHEVGRSTVHPG